MAKGTLATPKQMDTNPPGSKMAAKAFENYALRGTWKNPMHSFNKGIDLARGRNGAEGMRWNKKRTVHCNGEHRGSKFALT